MKILIIDGQGGKMGSHIVELLLKKLPEIELVAVGTNSTATAAMLKSGATNAATGENAVIVGSRNADVIVGAVGIVVADSMLGEITPKMACAVAQSDAVKILIPTNKCNTVVVGVGNTSMGALIDDAVKKIGELSSVLLKKR